MHKILFLVAIACIGAIEPQSSEVKGKLLCVASKNVFTEKTLEFERCAMQYAASRDFCSNCIEAYVGQNQAYDQLLKGQFTSTNNGNKSCGDWVNEEDRFNILRTHHTRTKDLWHSARCTSESANAKLIQRKLVEMGFFFDFQNASLVIQRPSR